jgi:hypothetical protein
LRAGRSWGSRGDARTARQQSQGFSDRRHCNGQLTHPRRAPYPRLPSLSQLSNNQCSAQVWATAVEIMEVNKARWGGWG